MTTYDELKIEFISIAKRILKKDLSNNVNTLENNKTELIDKYNEIIEYFIAKYNFYTSPERDLAVKELNYVNQKLENCLTRLHCRFVLPTALLTLIDPTEISDPIPDNLLDASILHVSVQPEEEINTDMEIPDFLRLSAQTINKNYSGDPLGLASFIDSMQLLNTLATTDALRTILISFIKSKLEGRAREALAPTDNTIDLIITALNTHIKPDSSRVIEGRILSLHLNNANPQDFSDKAEKLAESYRRSLILEGMSAAKATELTIDKTVELCRRNTRSDLVKSVLEATPFTNAKEVLAKLITQNTKVKQDQQILAYQAQTNSHQKSNSNPHKRFNSSKPNSNNRQNNHHQNNRNNNFNGNFNNNRNYSNNNFNPRFQNNNNFNQRPHNNNFNNQNRTGNQHRNIRIFTNSGNGVSPQELVLGDPQLQNHSQTPQQGNQITRF